MESDEAKIQKIAKAFKENIYEFTGGHRMLYEMSQILTMLDSANSLQDLMDDNEQPSKSLEQHLKEKINFWVKKLTVKD